MHRYIQEVTGQVMKLLFKPALWLFLSCFLLSFSANGNEMDNIVPGNWVELRGNLNDHGIFVARRVDLIELETEEVLDAG